MVTNLVIWYFHALKDRTSRWLLYAWSLNDLNTVQNDTSINLRFGIVVMYSPRHHHYWLHYFVAAKLLVYLTLFRHWLFSKVDTFSSVDPRSIMLSCWHDMYIMVLCIWCLTKICVSWPPFSNIGFRVDHILYLLHSASITRGSRPLSILFTVGFPDQLQSHIFNSCFHESLRVYSWEFLRKPFRHWTVYQVSPTYCCWSAVGLRGSFGIQRNTLYISHTLCSTKVITQGYVFLEIGEHILLSRS